MARRFVALLALGVGLAAGFALGSVGRGLIDAPADAAFDPSHVVSGAETVGQEDELTAERNLFPGPQTAIAMADQLGLDIEQKRQLYELQQRIDSESIALSRHILREERRLDRAFADGTVDIAHVDAITARIGELQARLRALRLRAHVATHDLLHPEQLLRFAALRGFEPAPASERDELED
ncbi:MAG TPA: Spy/CpxP family protein refolding chaperone [Ferrovibrio sp.]|uniref:Spy/CpxP family protein refolding chaperone n=1 Tax=Ferrovibrio sp. TaxID=1917215 RepID=UPI002ED0E92B